jgi:predicted DNA-binding protein (MmcQ/YjbR family)
MAHPRMYQDMNPAIKKLRAVCLALGEVFEKEAWGECTFRVVNGPMFAMTDNNHHQSGHVAVWVKAPAMAQEILISSDSKRFFKPPYMGHKGWVGVRLDSKPDWEQLTAILKDGYEMSLPVKKAARAASRSRRVVSPVSKARQSMKPPSAKVGDRLRYDR